MMLQLTPPQVSEFWDAIKYALVQTNRVPDDQVTEYTNKALEGFLSGKYQCWVIYELVEGGKQIHALGITTIIKDRLLGYDYLYMDTMYGYRAMTDDLIQSSLGGLADFARSCGCKKLVSHIDNKRIEYMAVTTGFKEVSRVFEKTL